MTTLRILTFNISGAVCSDRRFYSKRGNATTAERAAAASSFLDDLGDLAMHESVDLLVLQEVDRLYNGTETIEAAKVLAEKLNVDHVFSPAFNYHLFDRVNVTTGLASFSRWPIVSSKVIRFSQRRRRLLDRAKSVVIGSKVAQELVINVDGTKLTVVNAHLTHDCDHQKVHELETLLEHCTRRSPALLIGDLNTTPTVTRRSGMLEPRHFRTDECMRILERFQRRGMVADSRLGSFLDSPPTVSEICNYPTPPSSQPLTVKLDYLLLFPGTSNIELGSETVLPSAGSNHAPVAATLKLPS